MADKVYRGSTEYLKDEASPVVSDAAEFIARTSREYSPEHPLYIVAIGAITNVASAFLMEPSMTENCVVVWLGGNALSSPWAASEFNMMQDISAARVVIGSGVPFVQLPCMGVVDHFSTGKYELEHFLKGRGPLAEYLMNYTVSEAERSSPWKTWTRVIWDVTAVAWLVDDKEVFMLEEKKPRFMPTYEKQYEYDRDREEFVYVFHINRDALFDDLFRRIANYENL